MIGSGHFFEKCDQYNVGHTGNCGCGLLSTEDRRDSCNLLTVPTGPGSQE